MSFLGATHQEAVNALRACGNVIHLVVCKGYDKVDIDRAVAEGRLNRTGSVSSRSQSVSSLDVPDEESQQVYFLKYNKKYVIYCFKTFVFLQMCV